MGDTVSNKKENYMALDDFQEIWTNKIKPKIPEIAGTAEYASSETCESIIDELT